MLELVSLSEKTKMLNFKLSAFNKTMLYMLIFTMISSLLAYTIVVKAYDNLYDIEVVEAY